MNRIILITIRVHVNMLTWYMYPDQICYSAAY